MIEDLTGKKFGKLAVLYRTEDYIQPSGQHKRMWHCKCECGNECDIRASDLKSGNTKSCGCFRKVFQRKSFLKDLTGKHFGKLTVLYRLPDHITPSGQKQRMWHCKCECGNECDVYATQLKKGKKSCGCVLEEERKNKAIEKNKKLIEKRKNHEIQLEQRRQEKKMRIEKEKEKKRIERIEKNSLATKNPELLKEWDYIKNIINPTQISANSSEIAWWNCSLGHSYDMKIFLRTGKLKCGCPYCSIPARRVLKGFNDLETKYPQLAQEWHPTKNGDLKPDSVLCGSAKKVWWLGKCGHEYEQGIVNRVNGGSCPYCSHQKLLAGFNDFATKYPDLLSEWNYELNDKLEVYPDKVSPYSEKRVWWKCPFGHSYQAYLSNRCGSIHSGCPICDKENHTSFPEQAMFFYIKQEFPDTLNSDKKTIGMELDIFIPSIKTAIEYDGVNWHKNNQYELKKNEECKNNGITLIRIREEGLQLFDDCICIVRNNIRNNKSLSLAISKVLNIIGAKNNYNIDVDKDAPKIYGLYITNRKARSLKNTYPEIAKEWHPTKNGDITPEMVAPMSNKKVWWLGKCGHEWQMSLQDRTDQKCGCPICAGKKILTGFNDFATKFPSLLNEWNYELNDKLEIYPDKVAPHSDKKVWWTCKKCGYIWKTKIDSRTRIKTGCPKCGRKKVEESRYIKVRCIETNQIYNSLIEAEKITGVNRICIGNCCKGKQKTAGKYHWEYI